MPYFFYLIDYAIPIRRLLSSSAQPLSLPSQKQQQPPFLPLSISFIVNKFSHHFHLLKKEKYIIPTIILLLSFTTDNDKSSPEPLPLLLPQHLLSKSLSSLPKQNEIKICNTVDLRFFHHNGNGGKQRRRRPNKATIIVTIAVLLANAILATVNNLK